MAKVRRTARCSSRPETRRARSATTPASRRGRTPPSSRRTPIRAYSASRTPPRTAQHKRRAAAAALRVFCSGIATCGRPSLSTRSGPRRPSDHSDRPYRFEADAAARTAVWIVLARREWYVGLAPPGQRHRGASPQRAYLQPGVVVVWPGGWHLALASFGPPPLLPGPNDGSASAAGASTPSTPRVANATAMRFLILSLR